MKNPAPRFYSKWKNTIEIAVQENNYFLVFSPFLIKSFTIKKNFYIFFIFLFLVFMDLDFGSSDFFRNIFYLISAAFRRFRKEREWLISSRLDLWLWVIFIDDWVIFSPARS